MKTWLWPKRNNFFGIGDLVWACSAFKQWCETVPSRIHLVGILFYLLLSKPSLPLHLLVQFRNANPVSWLVLDKVLLTLNMFRRISMLRELSVVISWKSVILCPQISLFAGPLAGFQVDMVGQAVVSMVEQSTMTLHLGSFGLRIKYLLAPVRPSWENNVLNSGCTTLLAPR